MDQIQLIAFAHSKSARSPVDVMRVSRLRSLELDHSIYDATRLDFHVLMLVTEGTGRHSCDFEDVELERGDLFHIRPGQVHAFDEASTHDAMMLLFTPDAFSFAGIPQPPRWQPNTVLRPRPSDFETMASLTRTLESVGSERGDANSSEVSPYILGAVLGCIGGVLRVQRGGATRTQARYEDITLRFSEELDVGYAQVRSASAYAKKLGVTPKTLARACVESRGLTPKAMIDSRVALEGKRRLLVTSQTVEAIGVDLGFSEATNFVKFFRRIAGTTPDAFRRGEQAL